MQARSSESNSDTAKITPQDLNAEKSLLGAILLSDTAFPEILEKVKSKDFYDKNHATIFKAMTNLYNSHRPIDLLTLTSELRAEKQLKNIGGATFLTELTNFVPTAAHASAYADIISECAIRRRLIDTGSAIVKKAYEESSSIDDLIGNAEKELYKVSDSTIKSEYVVLEELLVDAYDRIENLHKNSGTLRGLKTGFKDLDRKTAGLQNGDLIIIGARPSMGKTTFAQNIAYNVATINKRGVLFFSMEMASNQIVDRMIADVSGIDSWKIQTGNVTDNDFAKIGDALGEMGEIPLYIDDSSNMTVLEIRNKARRAAHDHDIGLIVIDYLQLISGSERYAGNRVQEITEISRGLKQIARELNVPLIALAQLSRNVTSREDPRPVLSDLRDSGSIEQDADLVMMLHRVDYYHMNEEGYEPTNITELLIQKHRNGEIGKIELYFDDKHSRFMSLDKKHEK